MQVLFIIDPLPGLKAYKDSSVAMMRALQARGHRISVTEQGDLFLRDRVQARVQDIELLMEDDLHERSWWQNTGPSRDQDLASFCAVIMRKDPPFDMEYAYTCHLLSRAQTQGARVFNRGEAIIAHPEKLSIAEFPQFTSATMVSRNIARIKQFYQEHRDIVVKPLDGMGGSGIFRITEHDVNIGSILEMLTKNQTETIMAQRYIPDIVRGDKRILLINGHVVPYCLARIPMAGESRGNLAAGGRGVAQELSERDWQIAKTIAPIAKEHGLFLVGLDVIGDYLTEINVTSPTCFVEIAEQTNFNVAGFFAEQLERQVQGSRT